MSPQLPEPMRYIHLRLSGRPVLTYLWFIWLMGCCTVLLSSISMSHGPYSGGARVFSFVGATATALFVVRLIVIMSDREKRNWLVSLGSDGQRSTTSARSRIAVRVVPIVGLAAMVEYWFVK